MTNQQIPNVSLSIYLDLETTATSFDAGIWQIGAVISITDYDTKSTLCLDHDVCPQVTFTTANTDNPFAGATRGAVDDDTMKWLATHGLTPDSNSYGVLVEDNPTYGLASFNFELFEAVRIGLESINPEAYANLTAEKVKELIASRGHTTVYSWGNFDGPILENALRDNGLDPIFHYGSSCSLRDVHKYLGLPQTFRPDTSSHEAIMDADALRDFHNMLASVVQIKVHATPEELS